MIEIKNLDFGYKNQNVFKNISLNFEKGNIYGLLGENGVGKTTLLKLISGLQKPSAGECIVDGIEPFNRLPETLQKIFFISEDFAIPEGTPINDLRSWLPSTLTATRTSSWNSAARWRSTRPVSSLSFLSVSRKSA